MNTAWVIAAAAIGVLLGVFYFGGLWLTVRRISTTRRAASLLLISFLVRAGVVLSGFFLVMDGRWERLVACLAGFLLARAFVLRHVQLGLTSNPSSAEDTPGRLAG